MNLEITEEQERALEGNTREFKQFGLLLELSERPFKVENYSHYPFKVTFRDGGSLYVDQAGMNLISIGLNIGLCKGRDLVFQDNTMRDFKTNLMP